MFFVGGRALCHLVLLLVELNIFRDKRNPNVIRKTALFASISLTCCPERVALCLHKVADEFCSTLPREKHFHWRHQPPRPQRQWADGALLIFRN